MKLNTETLGEFSIELYESAPTVETVKVILSAVENQIYILNELRNNANNDIEEIKKWDESLSLLSVRFQDYVVKTDNLQESINENSEYYKTVVVPLIYGNATYESDSELPWILINELLYIEKKDKEKTKILEEIIKESFKQNIDVYIYGFTLLTNVNNVLYKPLVKISEKLKENVKKIVIADIKARAKGQAVGAIIGFSIGAAGIILLGRKFTSK